MRNGNTVHSFPMQYIKSTLYKHSASLVNRWNHSSKIVSNPLVFQYPHLGGKVSVLQDRPAQHGLVEPQLSYIP